MEEDESVPDKESDIKPRFYRPRTRSIDHMGDDVSFLLSLLCTRKMLQKFLHSKIYIIKSVCVCVCLRVCVTYALSDSVDNSA